MGSSARGFKTGDEGFTLIELLVAVIILGILAGIAIPIFLGQREQAQDASAKSTLRNAQTALTSYRVERGSFPLGDSDSVEEMEEILPTVDWRSSQFAEVTLDDEDKVGAVPFESISGSVVFGTRSASGECFYMWIIDEYPTRYGRNDQCGDPWETVISGGIANTGW